VSDPLEAAADAAMPSLALALDPVALKRRFRRGLPLLYDGRPIQLRAIRVTRHKPGRRCVIEYDVRVERPERRPKKLTLIGKVRARRSGWADFQTLRRVWDACFHTSSPDGIAVAEPVGVLTKVRMWLQRKVPGQVATGLLAEPGGTALASRIAEAAHKLHGAGVPAQRRHTMADELRILRDCLQAVAREQLPRAARLERLFEACVRRAGAVPEPVECGIHRDFYADQVIVDGERLYLIDFDLYCVGDPALDIGNFLGHITEQSLRTRGDPAALAECERVMEERFVELSGERVRPAVHAYAALTLARHVYLSTRFPDRRPLTGALLDLCEERLGVAG
jgi:hypothetical protein